VFLGTRHAVNDATSVKSPLLGKMAPSFSGEELKTNSFGGNFSLSKYRGDIVVVNFWASWCVPCQVESPNISSFAWQQKNNHVQVIGVVFNDSVGSATSFANKYGDLFPSIIDTNGLIANSYGVTSPPTTFVINAQGQVAATLIGPVSTKQLNEVVSRVRG
jgi:cytochrome c biogenesis protein CcmG/thiol:disulfide interchange protein DsbE